MPRRYKRSSLKTILIYCEWYCEYAFCLYLREIFHIRWSGFIITVGNWFWWSPVKTVERAINQDGYDHKFVWIDTDRSEIDDAKELASRKDIKVIENIPCIEAEILKLKVISTKWSSKKHKKIFLDNFPGIDLTEKDHYNRLFWDWELVRSIDNSEAIKTILSIISDWNL